MDTTLEGTFEIAIRQDGTVILLAPGFAKTLGVVLRHLCKNGTLLGIFADEKYKAEGVEVVAIDKLALFLTEGSWE